MAGKSKIDELLLIQLSEEGLHPVDIAEKMGVSRGAIETRMSVLGLDWERKKGGCKETNKDTQEEILKLYAEGVGGTTLAKKYKVDKKTIYNILNRHKVGTRSVESRRENKAATKDGKPRKHRISSRDKEIGSLYNEGYSIKEINQKLAVKEETIRYSLSKQGLYGKGDCSLKVRMKEKKKIEDPYVFDKTLRHDAFDAPTLEGAYWLGMFMADANVYDNRNLKTKHNKSIKITLQQARYARYHLETLKEWLQTNRKITDGEHAAFGKTYEHSVLSWTSNKMGRRLMELGVVPHKDGRFIPPTFKDSRDFWRGLVDGAGCVYHRKKGNIYLSGTLPIVEEWRDYCERVTGVDCVGLREQPGVWVGTVRFREQAEKIIKELYIRDQNRVFPALQHKAENAMSWL